MSPHTDNIHVEEMWNVFKCELQESINTFIRNFNSIKKSRGLDL